MEIVMVKEYYTYMTVFTMQTGDYTDAQIIKSHFVEMVMKEEIL